MASPKSTTNSSSFAHRWRWTVKGQLGIRVYPASNRRFVHLAIQLSYRALTPRVEELLLFEERGRGIQRTFLMGVTVIATKKALRAGGRGPVTGAKQRPGLESPAARECVTAKGGGQDVKASPTPPRRTDDRGPAGAVNGGREGLAISPSAWFVNAGSGLFYAKTRSCAIFSQMKTGENSMRFYKSLIGAAAVATLLAFASPASAQRHGGGGWHGHPGWGWHGHPGWRWGGPRVAIGIGAPFWGWGYPYAPYGYGYYPYAYAPAYAPQVYQGRVVPRQQPVDAKDVPSQDQ